jgi:hypothetical protein
MRHTVHYGTITERIETMSVFYLNWQRETIDEIDGADFENRVKFLEEKDRLLGEYHMCGHHGAYWSRRACKNWK